MLRCAQEMYGQVLELLPKFMKAIEMQDQERRIPGLYKMRLRYRLKMFWIRDVRQAFCSHSRETYRSVDWTYAKIKCSDCHKTLYDLLKDRE